MDGNNWLDELDAALNELNEAVPAFQASPHDPIARPRAEAAVERYVIAIRPLLSDEVLAFRHHGAYVKWRAARERQEALTATLACRASVDALEQAFLTQVQQDATIAFQELLAVTDEAIARLEPGDERT
jgi:hypothetical protein